jgi:TRAP-type C4-dicarboxylate transport system permease small subunit
MHLTGGPPPSFLGSAVRGVAVWAALAVAIQALLWAFPSSVPGAQKFALGFMLWSGMVGASLATRARRHIMLDAVVKKLTGKTQQTFMFLSGLTAAFFCAVLALLGTIEFLEQFRDWSQGEGIGEYDALPIPIWIATLAIPYSFWVMSARFLGQAVHDLVWGPPQGGADAHGIDLEALAKEGPAT